MKRVKDDCGCVHDGARWLELCPQHTSDVAEYDRAAREHRSAKLYPVVQESLQPDTAWLNV